MFCSHLQELATEMKMAINILCEEDFTDHWQCSQQNPKEPGKSHHPWFNGHVEWKWDAQLLCKLVAVIGKSSQPAGEKMPCLFSDSIDSSFQQTVGDTVCLQGGVGTEKVAVAALWLEAWPFAQVRVMCKSGEVLTPLSWMPSCQFGHTHHRVHWWIIQGYQIRWQ